MLTLAVVAAFGVCCAGCSPAVMPADDPFVDLAKMSQGATMQVYGVNGEARVCALADQFTDRLQKKE